MGETEGNEFVCLSGLEKFVMPQGFTSSRAGSMSDTEFRGRGGHYVEVYRGQFVHLVKSSATVGWA